MSIELFNRIETVRLSFFADKTSVQLFQIYDLDYSFLHHPADTWLDLQSYKDAKDRLESVVVVNDLAERGAALLKRSVGKITTNLADFQAHLQSMYARGGLTDEKVSRKAKKRKYDELICCND